MKRPLLLLFLLLSLADTNFSQNFNWSRPAGASQDDFGNAISVDASGNSYVTGSFKGTITFPGSTSFTSAGSGDIFVAKYDPSGNFLWARQAKDLGNDSGSAISLDGAGNAYVTGIVCGADARSSFTSVRSRPSS